MRSGKEYYYYGCYKKNKALKCPKHSIREDYLYEAVQKSFKLYLSTICDLEYIFEGIEKLPINKQQLKNVERKQITLQKECDKYKNLKLKLFEDMHDGLVDSEEYKDIKGVYDKKCQDITLQIEDLRKQIDILSNEFLNKSFIEKVKQYVSAEKLTSQMLRSIVKEIKVSPNREIEIVFLCEDEFKEMIKYAQSLQKERGCI